MTTSTNTRAFALMIVMIIAVACVIIAAGLTTVHGKGKESAVAIENGEHARFLAESGLQRAIAYANVIRTVNVDFDKVLDPDLSSAANANQAQCTGISSAPFNLSSSGVNPKGGATTFTPKFTEVAATTAGGGGLVAFPVGSGKMWRRVAENGGAYLVRFEDNADDYQRNPRWTNTSDNNLGPNATKANKCLEGITRFARTDNPARDRDNAIWILSMGIYPGTDPTTAKHRHIVRRLLNRPNTRQGAALYVGGNVSQRVKFHNRFGRGDILGSITNNSNNRYCGVVTSGGSMSSTLTYATDAICSGATTNNGLSTLASGVVVPPVFPAPAAATAPSAWVANEVKSGAWHDWQSPCNFYSDQALGFFYWDPTANGTACRDHSGPLEVPNADPVAVPGGCWVPILLTTIAPSAPPNADAAARVAPYAPYLLVPGNVTEEELSVGPFPLPLPLAASTDFPWEPNTATGTITDTGTGVIPASWYTTATTRNKPNWSLCGTGSYLNSQVQWGATPPNPNPTTVAFEFCAGCDGTKRALNWSATATAPRHLQFNLSGSEVLREAVPTGVYHVVGDYTHHQGDMLCAPTSQPNPSGTITYPMMTLIVEGNYVDQSIERKDCWGVGTKKNDYPSLVVGGNLTTANVANSHLKLAGSVFVGGTITVAQSMTVFGAVHVGTNLVGPASSTFFTWAYTNDIKNAQSEAKTEPSANLDFPGGT